MSEVAVDPLKFRALRFTPDGKVVRGGLDLLDGQGMVWVDLQRQGPPEVECVARRFGLHPLEAEDCLNLDQRPKLEEYEGHLFLVVHSFTRHGACELDLHELHAFVGKDFLLTVHADPIAELDAVFERAATDPSLGHRGMDFLLYLVTDRITDGHFVHLDEIADTIEDLEDRLLTRLSREDVEQIFTLKRTLVTLRRTVSPTRDVMGLLTKRGDPRISERTTLYFRDVYDHLVRVSEAVEADRDLLGNALDAYLSMSANRTNEIMKQLTLISVTFLPLSFLTGFFGMNFAGLPFDSRALMFGVVLACAAVPLGMLLWFSRKAWF